jgi:hypothetical protein
VLGVPDEKWGEILLAVVQRAERSTLDADGVIEWCREHLADYKRPRIVEFVDELPRDPSGKFRKPKFRTAWVAARDAESAKAEPSGQLAKGTVSMRSVRDDAWRTDQLVSFWCRPSLEKKVVRGPSSS